MTVLKLKNNYMTKSTSYSDNLYRNKFIIKQQELFTFLEERPNDLLVKKQMEFVSEVIKRGDENNKYGEPFDWTSAWQRWENKNF